MKIKDIVAFVPKSITPKSRGKIYRLYSLPSFDDGRLYETLDGKNIQKVTSILYLISVFYSIN